MLSIGELAEAAGMSAEQVRMWERRYGRPTAVRRQSGRRLYAASLVPWLKRIGEALERGHRPNQVLRLSDDELDRLLTTREPEAPPASQALTTVIDALRRGDMGVLRRWLLEMSTQGSALEFVRDHVVPFLTLMQSEREAGRMPLASDRAATQIIEDELRALRQQHPITRSSPRVLLTTFSGDDEGLGLQLGALVAAWRGVRVSVLGTSSPLGAIQAAAGATKADVVGICLSQQTQREEAEQRLRVLRELLGPGVRLVIGGDGLEALIDGPQGVEPLRTIEAWDDLLQNFDRNGPEAA